MNNLRKIFVIVSLAFAGNCSAGEWYDGGTLTDKGALIWQEASLANKIASSSDLVAAMYQKHLLNASITSDIKDVNDLAPYAIQLAVCVDGATKKEANPKDNRKMYTNQTVSGMAAICVMMMGWAK